MTVRSVAWLSEIISISIMFIFRNSMIYCTWLTNPLVFQTAIRTEVMTKLSVVINISLTSSSILWSPARLRISLTLAGLLNCSFSLHCLDFVKIFESCLYPWPSSIAFFPAFIRSAGSKLDSGDYYFPGGISWLNNLPFPCYDTSSISCVSVLVLSFDVVFFHTSIIHNLQNLQ
jgi:hypothetical protein